MNRPFKKFPVVPRDSFIDPAVKISDEEIDQNYKCILQQRRNGKFLSPKIVAHLEYFMNTLNLEYKSKTDNPFKNPSRYPALHYRMLTDGVSSDAIIESKESSSSSSSDMEGVVRDDLVDEMELNSQI